MASSQPNYLQKALSPNTITLMIRASIYEFRGLGETQTFSSQKKEKRIFLNEESLRDLWDTHNWTNRHITWHMCQCGICAIKHLKVFYATGHLHLLILCLSCSPLHSISTAPSLPSSRSLLRYHLNTEAFPELLT